MSDICKRLDIHHHSYADDTQLYVHYDRNCDISMKEAIAKLKKLHFGNRSVDDTQLFKT